MNNLARKLLCFFLRFDPYFSNYDNLRVKYKNKHDSFISLKDKYIKIKKWQNDINRIGMIRPWNRYIASCIYFAEQCKMISKYDGYDLCIAHNNSSLFSAFGCCRKDDVLVYDVVEIPNLSERSGKHSLNYKKDNLGSFVIDQVEKKIVERVDGFFTVSQGLADIIAQEFKGIQPFLLRNCREYEVVGNNTSIRSDCSVSSRDVLLLSIGSIYAGMGAEQAIDSLRHLPHHFHLAFLGSSKEDYIAQLHRAVTINGLQGRVHFLAPVSSTQLVSYASGADIGIIPRQISSLNNRISLPNRFFECVMARLPIAVGQLPDMADIITTLHNGIIFDQEDPRSIARSVSELYECTNASGYSVILEKAARVLSWESEQKVFKEVIDSLMKNKKKKSVALFANKNIRTNNRLYRMGKMLLDMFESVSIYAKDYPAEDLYLEGIKYYRIE